MDDLSGLSKEGIGLTSGRAAELFSVIAGLGLVLSILPEDRSPATVGKVSAASFKQSASAQTRKSGIATEIKVWTARAIATVLAEAGPQFERETGYKLIVSSGLPNQFEERANAGEDFDILITGSVPLDQLVKEGKIIADTRTTIARSGIGVAVRARAPKPDLKSVEAFKRAMLDAKSIAYLKDVGSGVYIARLLDQLHLTEQIKSKVTRPDTDIVSELVAKGEVELGLVVITQILTTPGVELAGPLPPEIQSYVSFVAGISAHAKAPESARNLINFLTGAIAAQVIKAQGMEPGASFSR